MYLNHKDLSNYYVIDIEADSLRPTTIWCVVIKNVGTGQLWRFGHSAKGFYDDLKAFIQARPEAIWIGHNALSYDVPNLNRLCDLAIPLDRVVDTLVLSYLYDPRMPGGHSLEAWGERLRQPKIEFNDFSAYTPEMLEYCTGDVELNATVFTRLTARMKLRGFSEKSCELEHQIRDVVNEQERTGFYFDIAGAESLRQRLLDEALGLEGPIRELFPPELKHQGTFKYRTRADGQPYASYGKHLERYPKVKLRGDEYDVYDWEEFNIGSPAQRAERLIRIGYKPTEFTPTGQPRVDEESLVAFADGSEVREARLIAEWLVLTGRSNMLGTWLKAVDRDTHRMHGKVFTCGAGTRRMTHSNPNTANAPKAKPKVKYGKECRSLWTVEDVQRRRLVGYDAKGLEMRMFAHYLDNPEAAELYINGDPHQVNADLLSIDRDPVKNVFYAFLYGAQDPKLGATGGFDRKWGKWARSLLIRGTPGLAELVEQIQGEFQDGGWIRCIDGGYVRCPSPHAALNYKLQSAGGIVMKQASIFLRDRVRERGLDFKKVGDIHDEGQHDAAAEDAEEGGKLAVQCIRDAGEELGFSVPLDGDYKVGLSWAETH